MAGLDKSDFKAINWFDDRRKMDSVPSQGSEFTVLSSFLWWHPCRF